MNRETWLIIADEAASGTLGFIAKQTGTKITAIVAGTKNQAKAVANMGYDRIIFYQTDTTPAENWALAIASAAEAEKPQIILSLNLPSSRTILGVVAARLQAAMAADVKSVSFDEDKVVVQCMAAEGKAIETLETTRCFAGIIAEGGDEAEPVAAETAIDEADASPVSSIRLESTSIREGSVNLKSAECIVSAGAGIGVKENLALIDDLAKVIHAEVGCSLPVGESLHWVDESRIVGSSNQRVAPKLYIAVGISGQPQHMLGVVGAKTIVAINNDPEAPIFSKCSYGIVGDLNKVVPKLTEALSAMK